MEKKQNNLAEYLFHEGTNFRSYDYMGAHRVGSSFVFRVWAPKADKVYLCGDFNGWSKSAGVNAVLDWGFWTESERDSVSDYYRSNGIEYEWHYVEVSDEVWARNIASRNEAVLSGESEDYYVDEGLLNKIKSRFEPPNRDEIDVWHVNKGAVNNIR